MTPKESSQLILSIIQNYERFGYNNFELDEETENVPTDMKVLSALLVNPDLSYSLLTFALDGTASTDISFYIKKIVSRPLPQRVVQIENRLYKYRQLPALSEIKRALSAGSLPLAIIAFATRIHSQKDTMHLFSPMLVRPSVAYQELKQKAIERRNKLN